MRVTESGGVWRAVRKGDVVGLGGRRCDHEPAADACATRGNGAGG
jgi:hypothetical protein